MVSTMKEHALALAREGFAVFPIKPGKKAPIHKGGVHNATTDEFQIEAWWTTHPKANIGVCPATCNVPQMVVDLDVKKADGYASWDALMANPEWGYEGRFEVSTPSGGRHLWFVLPEGAEVPPSTERLGPGIDVRSTGSYVLVPPSILDGKRYKWLEPREKTPLAPAWLVQMAGEPGDRDPDSDRLHPDIEGWDPDDGRNMANALLASYSGAEEGQRNDRTFQLVAALHGWAISHDIALQAVQEWNVTRNTPPLDREEIERTIQSAYEGNTQDPAGHKLADRRRNVKQTSLSLSPERPLVTPEKRQKRFLNWKQTMALKPPKWLVEGTIPEQAVILIYGAWGQFKTFLALDMLLHMMTGRDWAGEKVPRLIRGSYTTSEGHHGIRQRVAAWSKAHHESQEVDLWNFSQEVPAFRDPEAVKAFGLDLRDEVRPEFFCIDTVSHAMRGTDENATKDASEFMARAYELRDFLKSAVILVHHSGAHETSRARGSEELSQKPDVILRVTNPEDDLVVVEMTKMRDAERWPAPRIFRIEKKDGGTTLHYDPTAETREGLAAIAQIMQVIAILDVQRQRDDSFSTTEHLAKELAAVQGAKVDTMKKWLQRKTTTKALGILAPYVTEFTPGRAPKTWRGIKKKVETSDE